MGYVEFIASHAQRLFPSAKQNQTQNLGSQSRLRSTQLPRVHQQADPKGSKCVPHHSWSDPNSSTIL